jgi:outer membrane lipoprotein-sorting protein
MRKSPVFILFLFLIVGTVLAQTDLSPSAQQKFLLQVEKNLKKSQTIESNFIQEKHLSLFNDVLVSQGLFAFAAPDRLRWEITKPFHSLLIMNGREVSKYDFPDGKNPHKLQFPAASALSEVLNQIADIHQGKFSEEEKNYDIEVDEGKTLILVPKNPRMRKMVSRIEIGFSPSLDSIASVVIRENGGDFTRIVFESDRLNPALPDSLFSIP